MEILNKYLDKADKLISKFENKNYLFYSLIISILVIGLILKIILF